MASPLAPPLPDRGLGEVYLTAAPDDPRDLLALKLLGPAEPAHDARFADLLRRLRALSAAAIPNVREGGVRDGRRFVVVDLPDFDDLRSLASYIDGHREAGTLPHWSVAFALFNALALALDDGARAGVPHRGLTPASALLRPLAPTGPWQLWLLDFELAPWIRDPAVAPSPRYQPPEPHARTLTDHRRGDVFSLAVTLVELLSGADGPPGTHVSWGAFVRQRHAEVPAALAALRGDVPAAVWRAIAAALHPDPAQRPADAGDFAARVRAAARAEKIHRDVPAAEAPPPMPVGARRVAGREHASSEPVGWVRPERAPLPTKPAAPAPDAPDADDAPFGPGSRSLWAPAPTSLQTDPGDTLVVGDRDTVPPSSMELVGSPNDTFVMEDRDTVPPSVAEIIRPPNDLFATPAGAHEDPAEATAVYETGESRAASLTPVDGHARLAFGGTLGPREAHATLPALAPRDDQATLPVAALRGGACGLPPVRPGPRHGTLPYAPEDGPRAPAPHHTLIAAAPSRPPLPPVHERTVDVTLPAAPPIAAARPVVPSPQRAPTPTPPRDASSSTLRWVALVVLAGVAFMLALALAHRPDATRLRTDPRAIRPSP